MPDVKDVIKQLVKFRNDRGWGEHHTGPELARKLIIEAAEVNELFEWGAEPNILELEDELGDVGILWLYLCDKYKVDPIGAMLRKIKKNAIKYPVPK